MISLSTMAACMKSNVVVNSDDDYMIADEIQNALLDDGRRHKSGGLENQCADETIRKGIDGFAGLLLSTYDLMIENPDKYMRPGDGKINSRGYTNVYAGIKNLFSMFYCIGLHGKCDADSFNRLHDGDPAHLHDSDPAHLRVDCGDLSAAYKKMHGNKPSFYLSAFEEAGLYFSIDVNEKGLSLERAGEIEVRCPACPNAIYGLKAMAEAASRCGGDILNVFARCDRRALALPKKYCYDICGVTSFLPDDIRKYYIELHEFLLTNNYTYETKYAMSEIIFNYDSKPKKTRVFSIHIAMDDSYVKINSKLINSRSDFLDEAPQGIKGAVKSGNDCAKKNNPGACNPKCVGKNLNFSLDGADYLKCWILNFNLPVADEKERDFIKKWLALEINQLIP